MKYTMILSLFLVFLTFSVWAGQAAIVLKDTQVMDAPNTSALTIIPISKDTQVTLLKRKGGWYKIETSEQQTGWLRMLNVRFISEQESNQKSIAKILRETAMMPPASGITTGVRGMTDEEMKQNKQPQKTLRLEQLKNFVPTEESVRKFAEEGKLRSQDSVILPTK